MTCKECLYHEHCHSEIAYGMGTDDTTGEYLTDIDKRCKSFKNNSDYVKVRYGNWIVTEEITNLEKTVECSACHHKTYYPKCKWDDIRLTDYCPDCGARMSVWRCDIKYAK